MEPYQKLSGAVHVAKIYGHRSPHTTNDAFQLKTLYRSITIWGPFIKASQLLWVSNQRWFPIRSFVNLVKVIGETTYNPNKLSPISLLTTNAEVIDVTTYTLNKSSLISTLTISADTDDRTTPLSQILKCNLGQVDDGMSPVG